MTALGIAHFYILGVGGGGGGVDLLKTQTNTSVIKYIERVITKYKNSRGIKLVFDSPLLLSMTVYYLLANVKIRNLCSLLS